jgi:NADH-quinone oxidoreductase subunit K
MHSVSLNHYILLSAILFCIGVYGIIFNRKSVIGVLISVEVMLLGANINFVAFSSFLHEITGHLFAIFVLGVAAAEVGIGLAIIVIYFHSKGNILIKELNTIKDAL